MKTKKQLTGHPGVGQWTVFLLIAALLVARSFRSTGDWQGTPDFLDYPSMQRGAGFNLDALKAEMGKRMQEAEAASKGTGDTREKITTSTQAMND